jgi:hypothetical protein
MSATAGKIYIQDNFIEIDEQGKIWLMVNYLEDISIMQDMQASETGNVLQEEEFELVEFDYYE